GAAARRWAVGGDHGEGAAAGAALRCPLPARPGTRESSVSPPRAGEHGQRCPGRSEPHRRAPAVLPRGSCRGDPCRPRVCRPCSFPPRRVRGGSCVVGLRAVLLRGARRAQRRARLAASNSASSPLRPGVNAMLRKVAVAAASKPHVEIRQDGDQFYIKTSTTVRTTEINFKIGESFEEETVDGRKCRSLATWENENKIYCKQTLIEGDGPKTYWTRELANDELILTFGADDVVCTRIYVRE
uniref:Lipocalin/cytosolic fatty-acid binding domain-containing protein n=1 Tax=Melopsittacus undulatus TaxID=13146 RepID=A0A8C6JTA8_MELUD